MKKIKLFGLFLLFMYVLSSCSTYTCPTYSEKKGKPKMQKQMANFTGQTRSRY